VVAPPPPPPPKPAPAPAPAPAPQVQKITLQSKALFDFDKAVLKPEGKAALDAEVVAKLPQVSKLETIGLGEKQPVTGGKCQQQNRKELIACLQPDRRVEVEVKGEAVKK
jgi:OOP family OmpA-OmpF porin